MKRALPSYQDMIDELARGEVFGFFVDDTGSPGLMTTHIHPMRKSWVGVIVPPWQAPEVVRQFPSALQELEKFTGGKEFHFTEIYNGSKSFKGVPLELRMALIGFMSEIFATYEFPIFVQTLDPTNVDNFRVDADPTATFGPFRLSDPGDLAFLLLLFRAKKHLASLDYPDAKCRVFVDEGRFKHARAVDIGPYCTPFIADSLVCFARSNVILPIQLADFAAFIMNRMQLLLGKETLSDLDKTFLELISPVSPLFLNLDVDFIDPDKWNQRFPFRN